MGNSNSGASGAILLWAAAGLAGCASAELPTAAPAPAAPAVPEPPAIPASVRAAEVGDRNRQASATYKQASSVDPDHNPEAGDWGRARELYREAARLYGEERNHRGRAMSLYALGTCLRPDSDAAGGEWWRAAAAFSEAAEAYRLAEDPAWRAWSLYQEAYCRVPTADGSSGSWRQAEDLYALAGRSAEKAEDLSLQASCLHWRASCILWGDLTETAPGLEEAAAMFAEAARLRAKQGEGPDRRESLLWRGYALAQAAEMNGEWQRAAAAFERAADEFERAEDFERGAVCEEWVEWCLQEAGLERPQ